MSYYFTIAGSDEMERLTSTSGWIDFKNWIEKLSDCSTLQEFADQGICDDLPQLLQECQSIMKLIDTDDLDATTDNTHTLENLIRMVKEHANKGVVAFVGGCFF